MTKLINKPNKKRKCIESTISSSSSSKPESSKSQSVSSSSQTKSVNLQQSVRPQLAIQTNPQSGQFTRPEPVRPQLTTPIVQSSSSIQTNPQSGQFTRPEPVKPQLVTPIAQSSSSNQTNPIQRRPVKLVKKNGDDVVENILLFEPNLTNNIHGLSYVLSYRLIQIVYPLYTDYTHSNFNKDQDKIYYNLINNTKIFNGCEVISTDNTYGSSIRTNILKPFPAYVLYTLLDNKYRATIEILNGVKTSTTYVNDTKISSVSTDVNTFDKSEVSKLLLYNNLLNRIEPVYEYLYDLNDMNNDPLIFERYKNDYRIKFNKYFIEQISKMLIIPLNGNKIIVNLGHTYKLIQDIKEEDYQFVLNIIISFFPILKPEYLSRDINQCTKIYLDNNYMK
jgi:hypothetical protein